MTTEEILDHILVPRPNGSQALEQVADFLATALSERGATVTFHLFEGTPHGFQLAWIAALLLMGGYLAAIAARRYRLALMLMAATAVLLLLEFEALRSPVSGLLSAEQRNVVGTYPGSAGGPTLIFAAHYDATTHFGDHRSWARWGFRQGPATAAAVVLASIGLMLKRRGRELPRVIALPVAALSVVPFAAMFWFQTIGPVLRAPSPGAVDNGGSVAALLRLADHLALRPPGSATQVRVVFLASEEERALGSWAYAQTLDPPDRSGRLAVVNLESVGVSEDLAYIAEDGFVFRRFRSSPAIIAFVNEVAVSELGAPLVLRELPRGTLTDGRSFLAHGIEAITLRAYTSAAFPHRLHSEHDSRDRISATAIDRAADLLDALVAASDADPRRVPGLSSPGPRAP